MLNTLKLLLVVLHNVKGTLESMKCYQMYVSFPTFTQDIKMYMSYIFLIAPALERLPGREARLGAVTP